MERLVFTLSGTHCTGKTTLLERLQYDSRFGDFLFIDSVTRDIQALGFPINEEGTDYNESQLLMLSRDVMNLFITCKGEPYVLVDRGLFDTFIYTQYLYILGKVSKNTYDCVKSAWREHSSKYTLHFILDPNDVSLENDGVRSQNPYFREQIHRLFQQEIHRYRDKKQNVVVLSGTVEERVEKICQNIKKYGRLI